MSPASWAHRHARTILFLLLALVAAGLVAAFGVPVSLFPQVSFPRLRIDLQAGDRPAERMTIEVTTPVEEALRAIPGVRGVQSASSRGAAQIWLTFDWGSDMTNALLQAQSQANKLLPTLPPGTVFDVKRMDPTVFPIIAYSLTSDTRSLTELHDLAQYQLAPVLSTVTGVAKVDVTGGGIEEYRVVVDLAKLQAHNLALNDVAKVLSAANVLTAVGRVEDRDKLYLILTDTSFKNTQEIAATILQSGPGGVVRLSDIAQVVRSTEPQFTRTIAFDRASAQTAPAHSRPAVLFNVYQQPGGNTVQIARGVRDMIDSMRGQFPDVQVVNWYDQSDLILASAASVRDAVIIGVILAAGVLLVFLRDWKMTLIATFAVPVVLAVTALLLYALHQSFNIMTLGGMAAAVGLVIDDAIVMSEHIVRRLRAGSHAHARGRVLHAADEFTKPLTGSSLSTIVIHIPPAFMIGVFGAFFAALSLSMASSLVISFFVAWLAIPILAAVWLTGTDTEHVDHGPLTKRAHSAYARFMGRVLSHAWLVLLVAIPLGIGGYIAYQHLASGVMPAVDEGGFILDYIAPPGASATETDRLLRQVEAIIQAIPEVQTYSRRTGYSLGGDLTESNMGDYFVRLKPLPRRPIKEIMDGVQTKVEHTVPGLDIELAQLMEDRIGDLTGKPEPVVVNIYSDDERQLADLSNKVQDALGKINGVQEVRNGIIPAGDALDIEVDRVRASLEGVDPDSLTRSLGDLLSGNVTTQVQRGPKLVGVRVWVPRGVRKTSRDILELPLRAPDGHVFPLERVARVTILSGQPEITRDNLKRYVAVTARSTRDLGSTIADVRKTLDAAGFLPPGIRYTLGGLYEQQQIAFQGMLRVICAAAVLVFVLLLFLYESFRVAISIMLTTGLAIGSVFIGLWLTGTELNVSSLMGMVMIVGNVTEVAIFFYSEYADTGLELPLRERLIAAGNFRMRAILMSSLAAILALLPLALGIGQGSGMLQPLAIAIIAGLIVQFPLVLLVLPMLLALWGAGGNGRVEGTITAPGEAGEASIGPSLQL